MKTYTFFNLLLTLLIIETINAQPAFVWQKTFGGSQGDQIGNWYADQDSPDHSICATPDNGFIFCSFSSSSDGDLTFNHGDNDFWIVKSDSIGNIQWEKSYGGSNYDIATSIVSTSDGGYVFCGFSASSDGDIANNNGQEDFTIVKLNQFGTISWVKSYGGSQNDEAFSISQTKDGGYIVGGITYSNNFDVTNNHGGGDFWLVKLNSNGIMDWQKTFGGSSVDWASSVKETPDLGYIISGYTFSTNGDVNANHGSADVWVVKTDSLGNIDWEKTYGGTGNDWGSCIINTFDGGYAFSSFASSNDGDVNNVHGGWDYWLVKLNNFGTIEWEKAFGGTGSDEAYDVIQTPDSGFVVTGATNSFNGDITKFSGVFDYWVLKSDKLGNLVWQQTFGGTGGEWAVSSAIAIDKGILIAGSTSSNDLDVNGNNGSWDMWIVKLPAIATKISELENTSEIIVYPNPTMDNFEIALKNVTSTISAVTIYNNLGMIVYNELTNENTRNITIPVSEFASGNYKVLVRTGDYYYTENLIKK